MKKIKIEPLSHMIHKNIALVFFASKIYLLFYMSIVLFYMSNVIPTSHLGSRHMYSIAHFAFSLRYQLHVSQNIIMLSISHFQNSHAPMLSGCYHPNCCIKNILNNYFFPLTTFPITKSYWFYLLISFKTIHVSSP